MHKLSLVFIFVALATCTFSQATSSLFVTNDISNFRIAYDKIISTTDTNLQAQYLQELYINKASEGLKSLIENRNYTIKEYLGWITKYPKFWQSLWLNTGKLPGVYKEIEADINKLKQQYPELTASTIYFTMGAFRTNGMAHGNQILIGSELALADKSTDVSEFPKWRQTFYKTQEPLKELALLCTHEYIHTQQKPLVENLLSKCLYEGVAEFVSCKVTGKPSAAPAIAYGKAHEKAVEEKFVSDLFLMSNDNNWLWGENRNEFKVRDLGYYIGYEICERYYMAAADKKKAIKELIELDYNSEKEVERIVESSKLLPKSLDELYADYDKQRPTVIAISPFENGSQSVAPGRTKITITFSEPLLKYNTGIDFGPLGDGYFPKLSSERTFSDDGKSWSFEADLLPNRQYQVLISNNFRKENGVRLKSYLLDFKTGEK